MNNNMMINPANYYNPFAKYNYTSKTRGVYMPKESEPLVKMSPETEKTGNIYSENYDAAKDLENCLKNEDNKGLFGFMNNIFKSQN